MTKIVKICGIRTQESAEKAIDSGADLIGTILVPNRSRTIDHEVGKIISSKIKQTRINHNKKYQSINDLLSSKELSQITDYNEYFLTVPELIIDNGPFLVGVFRNQSINDVFEIAQNLKLDIIQLHGNEDLQDYLQFNAKLGKPFGIIKRFVIPKDNEYMDYFCNNFLNNNNEGGFLVPLLDSEVGGEGKVIDWTILNDLKGKYILAGGLNPNNLIDTNQYTEKLIGFDVSGGVEDNEGNKDFEKIDLFVKNGKLL